MVAEVRPDHPSDWAAVESVAQKLGIGSSQKLLNWIRRARGPRWIPVSGPGDERGINGESPAARGTPDAATAAQTTAKRPRLQRDRPAA